LVINEQRSSEGISGDADIEAAIKNLDFDAVARTYQEQN
jgi:hypothetical protein